MASLMSYLAFGKEMHPGSIASCIVAFEGLRPMIRVEDFHPFQTMWMAGGDSSNMAVISLSNDWLNLHLEIGVRPDKAFINLVDNWDRDEGMVTVATTILHLCGKKGCPESLRLKEEEMQEVSDYILENNFGNIVSVLEKDGLIRLTEQGRQHFAEFEPQSGRSFWKKKLDHDVWIHPAFQEPFRCDNCRVPVELIDIHHLPNDVTSVDDFKAYMANLPEEERKFGDYLEFSCHNCDITFKWRGVKGETPGSNG